jgi:hypothetical protein
MDLGGEELAELTISNNNLTLKLKKLEEKFDK